MGVTNAPVYPVISSTIGNWFPPGSWAFPNAVTQAGLAIAQAATGPLVTMLILRMGVHASFYLLAPIGFVAGLWWWFYGRDLPSQHSRVTPHELRFIAANRAPGESAESLRNGWKKVILKPDVLLLSASYFCMNYVFFIFAQWLFTYLVEARGFSALESGFLYALPFATGALLALVGGAVSDAGSRRFGSVLGCRVPAMIALVARGDFADGWRVCAESLPRGGCARALLWIHAVCRSAVLGRGHLHRRTAHRIGDRCDEHRRQHSPDSWRPSSAWCWIDSAGYRPLLQARSSRSSQQSCGCSCERSRQARRAVVNFAANWLEQTRVHDARDRGRRSTRSRRRRRPRRRQLQRREDALLVALAGSGGRCSRTRSRGTAKVMSLTACVLPNQRCNRRNSIIGWPIMEAMPSQNQVEPVVVVDAVESQLHFGRVVDDRRVHAGLHELAHWAASPSPCNAFHQPIHRQHRLRRL